MAEPVTTDDLTLQNFFSTSLSASINSTDTVIPLNSVPNGTEGFLVIDQDNSSREVIYYTSKSSSSVTCPDAATGRGLGNTTATSHSSGATVKQNVVSEYFTELQNGHAMAAGTPIRVYSENLTSMSTGTTVIPYDNTVPQNTEGDQVIDIALTPTSATNHLLIEATIHCSSSVANTLIAALFQDSTAGALSAIAHYQATPTASVTLKLTHDMVAGTTSSTTFKVRVGGASAGTTTINGSSGGAIFGGVMGTNIKVTEYKA